jgi:mannitol-1-phosphate/altronate dehydrogenase
LASAQTAADQVAAVMAIEAIFPPSLAGDTLFCQTLAEQLDTIHSRGAAGAVDEFARQSASCFSSASH